MDLDQQLSLVQRTWAWIEADPWRGVFLSFCIILAGLCIAVWWFSRRDGQGDKKLDQAVSLRTESADEALSRARAMQIDAERDRDELVAHYKAELQRIIEQSRADRRADTQRHMEVLDQYLETNQQLQGEVRRLNTEITRLSARLSELEQQLLRRTRQLDAAERELEQMHRTVTLLNNQLTQCLQSGNDEAQADEQ